MLLAAGLAARSAPSGKVVVGTYINKMNELVSRTASSRSTSNLVPLEAVGELPLQPIESMELITAASTQDQHRREKIGDITTPRHASPHHLRAWALETFRSTNTASSAGGDSACSSTRWCSSPTSPTRAWATRSRWPAGLSRLVPRSCPRPQDPYGDTSLPTDALSPTRA